MSLTKFSRKIRRNGLRFWLLGLLLTCAATRLQAQAGPPFQTDDPTPVDLGHYEAYVFGTFDGTGAELDSLGPAFEFNWGAIPRVQLHAILAFGEVLPTNNPAYLPGGTGPSAFGLLDTELGFKFGFIKQTRRRPQIGSFTMFEIPTGNSARGLSVGKVWYKLPLWATKDFGKTTVVGGAGYTVVPQTGYTNYPYGGLLVKRILSEQLELSVESFTHGSEGFAAAQTQASSMIDAGGYYHFKAPGWQLLFAYGHSVAGQTENYGYLGLYKTWGHGRNDKPAEPPSPMASHQPR